MNDNSGSIDDRLKPASAKFFNRTTNKLHNRFECRDFLGSANLGKFAPDQVHNHGTRQIAAPEGNENFVYRGNFPSRQAFYLVVHINPEPFRERRGTVLPITAAHSVRASRKMLSTFSSLGSATQSSNAPAVLIFDIRSTTVCWSRREAIPRLIAVVAMPVPSGFVRTNRSPGRAFAFVVTR